MYDILPDEDAYWEKVRERREKPPRRSEPEPETDWLFLDEEEDDLESEYGCRMSDICEGDLINVLDKYTGTDREYLSAVWDERFRGIRYSYLPEQE